MKVKVNLLYILFLGGMYFDLWFCTEYSDWGPLSSRSWDWFEVLCHMQLDFQFDQLKGVCSLCGSVLTDILYELWNEYKHNVRGFCNRVKVEHLWIVWHKSSALLLLVSKLEKQADKRSVYVRMQSDLVLWKLQLLTASQTQPTQRDWSY